MNQPVASQSPSQMASPSEPSPKDIFRFGRMPVLDGLRGIAVFAVILYHGTPFLKGGFIGVDIFFVLSGFLITSLLVGEYQRNGKIRLKQFYIRRFLRLMPALYLMLLVFSILAVVLVTDPKKLHAHLVSAGYAGLYVSNWVRALGIHDTDLLVHTWSLSIEEQFYLLWPPLLLLLLVVVKRLDRIAVVAFLLVGASSGWRAFLMAQGAVVERLYNGLDTRADGLMLGCLVALLLAAPNVGGHPLTVRRLRSVFAWVGPLCVLGLMLGGVLLRWRSPSMYLGLYLVVGLLASGLLVHLALSPTSIFAKLCNLPVLRWVGQRSYGLYLWHYPTFHILHRWFGLRWSISITLGSLVTVVFTELSFRYWEAPMLKLKERFRPPTL